MARLRRLRAPLLGRMQVLALFILIGIPGFVLPGPSWSVDAEPFGKWQGSLEDDQGMPIKVTLEFKTDYAELDFGVTRSCIAAIQHVSSVRREHIYGVFVRPGKSLQGWCKNLRNGVVKITKNGDNKLSVHLVNRRKRVDETVILNK